MVYKVFANLDEVDLNLLAKEAIKKELDFCIADDCLFFYKNDITPTQISNIMRRIKITNFVIKAITQRPEHPESSFSDLWCFEKINEEEEANFNNSHQTELQKMMDNIESIRRNLRKDKLLKEELNGDRSDDGETKTRPS